MSKKILMQLTEEEFRSIFVLIPMFVSSVGIVFSFYNAFKKEELK